MKKKQIEKIPYLTLPKVSRNRKVKFIGVTAWKNIGNERHIILEVYRNKKDSMQIPVIRYAATKKDWGVYRPDVGEWSREKIETDTYRRLCWHRDAEGKLAWVYEEIKKENRLYSDEDLSRIKNFFSNSRLWEGTGWWKFFEENETNIKHEAHKRKYERRRQRLKERGENTPELHEKALLEWADNVLFNRKHYLYYKKKGRKATLCCSACGGVYSGSWKAGESFESMFERGIQEPREGQTGRCILCDAVGQYKPQGKAKIEDRKKDHVFLADRYLEKGVVLRYIELGKSWILEEIQESAEKREMHGAYEELDGIEIARTYFLPGEKVQTDFHKHNPCSGEDFWDDCNLYGMANIGIGDAYIHPDSWDNMKGTFLQYSAMEEYSAVKGKLNAMDYLERYMHFPQIEMLVKMKLYGIVERILKGYCGIIKEERADRPDIFLGIRKEKVKLLMEEEGDARILEILQKEKKLGQNWTWQQVKALAEIKAENKDLTMVLQIMTIQKFLNNISKYAGCEYGTRCSTAENRLIAAANTYFDYLQMRKQLGYSLENTVYQKPRDLEAAHDRMVAEINKEKVDARMKEVEERFPDIKKNYRKLRKRYFFEDDNFIIRPARSAEEIVIEGRVLHHCVGGNNYLDKHNRGESYILMLRFKNMPETPYITVEIDRQDRILQWYGNKDKKPDEENMQKWLDIYVARLKGERLGIETRAEEEAMMQLMVAG